MFEAKLLQGSILKKILDAIREVCWKRCYYSVNCISNHEFIICIIFYLMQLVTDANLDCTETGITMQAMDSSHVSLCALKMNAEGKR